MRFNTGTRSIAALVLILATANAALAGGRRGVYYMVPQQGNRSFQQYPHDDALDALQSRGDVGSRGLQPDMMMDLDARLSAMERDMAGGQRSFSSAVVTRDFRNARTGAARGDRAGGVIIAEILFKVLGALKQIEASPNQLSGVQKVDALSQVLKPLVDQILSQSGAQGPVEQPIVDQPVTPAVDAELQPLIKLTEELKAVQESLKKYEKEYEAEQARQMELQKKREALRKAAKEAFKKVSDDFDKASKME